MFLETSFPLGIGSPLPPFTSCFSLVSFASSSQGLSSSGFLFFLKKWEISVTQFDEEALSVDFLLSILEIKASPLLQVKTGLELPTRVAFRANSATFPTRLGIFCIFYLFCNFR
uniref:Uncharacterized protein n=1 Tax=Urocitellus parryii TaxID=9999 RepID=A0A8D2I3U4_UROPR